MARLFFILAALSLSAALAGRARADDDAQFKAEMRHFAHTIRDTAKEAGKVAEHATRKAIKKTDDKLSGIDQPSGVSIGYLSLLVSQLNDAGVLTLDSEYLDVLLYASQSGTNQILEINPDAGTGAVIDGNGTAGFVDGSGGADGTAEFSSPYGVAQDDNGVYVADAVNNRIRAINSGAETSTLAGNGMPGYVDGTGGATGTAEFLNPEGVATDGMGNYYVADTGNNRIRMIDSSGNVTTVPGGDSSLLSSPYGVAVPYGGANLYVANTGSNQVLEIDPSGNVTVLAGTGVPGFADGVGGPSGVAQLNQPTGVAVDLRGDVFVADSKNNRIRVIHP